MQGLPDIGWFEVHAENSMGAGGPPHRLLEWVRERYPLPYTGWGFPSAARARWTSRISASCALIDRYEPGLFSNISPGPPMSVISTIFCRFPTQPKRWHMWRRMSTRRSARLGGNSDREPSTYVAFDACEMGETEFLCSLLAERAAFLRCEQRLCFGAKHGFDADAYLDAFPIEHAREIHLAGHFEAETDEDGRFLSTRMTVPSADAVWSLYARALRRTGPLPTLIEWDNDIPEFERFEAEAEKAEGR